MIDIEVNGEPHQVAPATRCEQLVDTLTCPARRWRWRSTARVVPRRLWPAHVLLAQDKIDIVSAIGGG